MAAKRVVTVRKTTLSEEGADNALAHLTPEQRIGLIEQLTIDAWAMQGVNIAEQRLQRHVVRLERREG